MAMKSGVDGIRHAIYMVALQSFNKEVYLDWFLKTVNYINMMRIFFTRMSFRSGKVCCPEGKPLPAFRRFL